jgi:predicted transcriptional regulator
MRWQEKYTTMELLLTLDAQQAEKERDCLGARLALSQEALERTTTELNTLKSETDNLTHMNKEQEMKITQLEDKCAWGRELEQVRNTKMNTLPMQYLAPAILLLF